MADNQVNDPVIDTDEIVYEGRPSRGRKRKIPTQSRSDRKRLYNTNKTHINSKGNVSEEKIFNETFECSCTKNCTGRVSLDSRRRLFSQFWTSASFAARCAYLNTCVRVLKRDEGEESEEDAEELEEDVEVKKREPRTYTIFGTEVCQKAILGTLQISDSRITKALQKLEKSDNLNDNRGKLSGGWNALSRSKTEEVWAHIASFPRYISHYTRGKTESKYLSSELNLSKIYELYKVEAEDPVSRSFYKDIFYKSFNLRFKKPKKDTCQKCDRYALLKKTSVGAELEIIEEWHETHLMRSESLQARMKADCDAAKNDNELETLTFDMQKTLPLPKLSTGIAYYKRQLNLYNFGIHTGSTGNGKFNIWMENEASKGTQEVGSCLKLHIEGIKKPIKKLILWSDSCGGQNRSIKFVLMMMFILENHPTLECISMRYLLSGHSFLPNDREFGEAETAMKRHSNLYTDEKYMEVMRECRTKNKFDVVRMSHEDFFSVKNLEALITNRKIDMSKEKVRWFDTHEIFILKNQPGILKMRKDIDGVSQTVDVRKIGRRLNLENVVLDSLWPTGKPLSKEKIKDLRALLELVPAEDRKFYDFLNDVQGADYIDDIDGFDQFIDFDPELDELEEQQK